MDKETFDSYVARVRLMQEFQAGEAAIRTRRGKARACPFCGSKAILSVTKPATKSLPSDPTPRHWFECGECSARGPYVTEDFGCGGKVKALDLWNRRADNEGDEQ